MLSEQELIDCPGAGDCGGGGPDFAFQLVVDLGGLASREDYPYRGENGKKQIVRLSLILIAGHKQFKNSSNIAEMKWEFVKRRMKI